MLFREQAKEVVRLHIKKSPKVIATAAVIGLFAAGGAFAYWTANGTGTGMVQQATPTQAMTVVQDRVTGLTPGGPAADLKGNVINPNAYAVNVTSLTASVTLVAPYSSGIAGVGSTSDTTKPACTAADFEISGTGLVTGSVPAAVGAVSGYAPFSGLKIALKETGANQDNCKTAGAIITYAVQ